MNIKKKLADFFDTWRNRKIVIHGLGLNGGGIASAGFFLEAGIPVLVTDMKSDQELKPAIDQLAGFDSLVTWKLGGHELADFSDADLVIKSPAVRPGNRFEHAALENGGTVTTDISMFLDLCPATVLAVTGSKGKSTTVSALYHMLRQRDDNTYLGGNITISPLTFLSQLDEESVVVLELSSWQLRDMPDNGWPFAVSSITNLMRDHLNYYGDMQSYLDDKVRIAHGMETGSMLLIPSESEYVRDEVIDTNADLLHFGREQSGAELFYRDGSCFLAVEGAEELLFQKNEIPQPGEHTANNMMIAAGMARLAGLDPEFIAEGVRSFPGVPFRMQPVRELHGVTWINDTTATMPDAAVSAIESYNVPLVWIGGGSDKECDFSVLKSIASKPTAVFLLSGSATDLMLAYLGREDVVVSDSLEELVSLAADAAAPGSVVLFSPGATSFGLFTNEFHRGKEFNRIVEAL
jgi:UDP-N-acetylmuramoylalanine--D-glutamate ligase